MMNLGPEKGQIIRHTIQNRSVQKILQIGGYCGYSSLTFSYLTKAQIHTIEIESEFIKVARQIQQHAGVSQQNHISVGTISTLKKQIQQRGPYDLIFIDHVKGLYLSDFLKLEQYGVIKKGTLVIGDNIIYPGSPDYLENFKKRQDYESTLYHSYLQYCNIPDAVLVSEKL